MLHPIVRRDVRTLQLQLPRSRSRSGKHRRPPAPFGIQPDHTDEEPEDRSEPAIPLGKLVNHGGFDETGVDCHAGDWDRWRGAGEPSLEFSDEEDDGQFGLVCERWT